MSGFTKHGPPVADDHVHLFFDGDPNPEKRRAVAALDVDSALERALELLSLYRAAGILRVREGGDPRGLNLAAAKIAARDPERYSALEAPGAVIRREGRYGSFLGPGVETVGQAVRLIEKNAAGGATHLKILATGANSLDEAGVVGERQFAAEEFALLCEAARANGLKVMVHANGPLGWLLPGRPDTVEHGFGLTPEDLRAFADLGIAWTPTLGAWEEIAALPWLTAPQREVVRQTSARQRRMVAAALWLGVKIALGSDAGTPGVAHVDGTLKEASRLAEAAALSPKTDEATG